MTVVTIQVQDDFLTGVLYDARFQRMHERIITTPLHEGLDTVVEMVCAIARDLCELDQDSQRIGIAIDPTFSDANGDPIVRQLRTQIEEAFASFPQSVKVVDATQARAFATLVASPGRADMHAFLYVYADRRLSSAIIMNGVIWHGMQNEAGQIEALLTGWRGEKSISLGQVASGQSIAREYWTRSRRTALPTLEDVIFFDQNHDLLAQRVIHDGARALGAVIAPLLQFLDLPTLVCGGRLPQETITWWPIFNEIVRTHSPVTVQIAPPEAYPALLGTAHLLQHRAI